MSGHDYGNNSISMLKGADRIRTRPESMLGSNGLDGAKHTVIEMVGNSIDEILSGYGKKLIIQHYDDGSVSVRDFGRGVPLGWNEKEQQWNYFLIYEELYAGGKYESNQEILRKIDENNEWDKFDIHDYPYLITVGLNGVGAYATQGTSEYCVVSSFRDKKKTTMKYEKGSHILDKLITEDISEENGTFVRWKPDIEVFTDVNIPSKWIKNLCKGLSYTTNIDVTFVNENGEETFFPASNIDEELFNSVGNVVHGSNFLHTKDDRGDICICFADIAIGKGGRGMEFFNNKVSIKGGVHQSGVSIAIADFFNEISKEVGVKIRESDYAGKFSVIVTTLCNKVSYRGQTKDSMDDNYVLNCIYNCMYDLLRREKTKGSSWLKDIIEETTNNAKNRIAVAEMSKSLKEVEKSFKKGKVSHKFVSCETYDEGNVEETELWIFEGNSAAGRFLTARDGRYQCYLPVRGKSLNIFKATLDRIIANAEIRDMIFAFGCGIDLGIDGFEMFDISKLKVGKIIIATDADVDGGHIAMLLFLIFYRLFPELLYRGKVYIAEAPLYSVELRDGTSTFCIDDSELEEIRKTGNILRFDRFKGLGEMNADQLWETMANPATRRLRQVKIDRNDTSVYDVIEVLFGKSTERRKRLILSSMLGKPFDEVVDNMSSISDYIETLDLNTVEVEEITY